MTPPIRVLVVDDHPVVRDGVTAVIQTQPDLKVAGIADTGTAAIRQVEALVPDVVLMDLQMPELDGVRATAAIASAHPDVHVLVLVLRHRCRHHRRHRCWCRRLSAQGRRS